MASKPWSPPRVLEVGGKDPNYHYRWVREDNYHKAVAEGGVPVKSGGKETILTKTEPDSVYKYRSLILMKFPRDQREQRNKYYESVTQSLLERCYRVDNRYGTIEVKKGGE